MFLWYSHKCQILQGGQMKKVDKSSAPDLDVISNSETPKSSRRDFFKKAVVYSASAVAASSILAPVKALAEDTQR